MICKQEYEAFCINTLGGMQLFETEETREKFFSKVRVLRNGVELKLVKISRDISEEEFEEAGRTKQDSFFLVLARRYVDDMGFSKIEYL